MVGPYSGGRIGEATLTVSGCCFASLRLRAGEGGEQGRAPDFTSWCCGVQYNGPFGP